MRTLLLEVAAPFGTSRAPRPGVPQGRLRPPWRGTARAHEGVIFDLVAAQSPSYKGRGIARYSTELVRALVKRHPEIVSSIVVHPELDRPEGMDDLDDWLTTAPDWAAHQSYT